MMNISSGVFFSSSVSQADGGFSRSLASQNMFAAGRAATLPSYNHTPVPRGEATPSHVYVSDPYYDYAPTISINPGWSEIASNPLLQLAMKLRGLNVELVNSRQIHSLKGAITHAVSGVIDSLKVDGGDWGRDQAIHSATYQLIELQASLNAADREPIPHVTSIKGARSLVDMASHQVNVLKAQGEIAPELLEEMNVQLPGVLDRTVPSQDQQVKNFVKFVDGLGRGLNKATRS